MVIREQINKARKRAEDFVVDRMQKFQFPPFGNRPYRRGSMDYVRPPYEREYSPHQIKQLAERQSLLNNSIEEKVNQAFRRGFTGWEKSFVARCPECGKDFQTYEPFKDQLGSDGDDINTDDIDFSKPRKCPNCEELVNFETPDPEDRKEAQQFFRRANMQNRADELLPRQQSSVSQTFQQLCKEVAFDIQIFDDGWMIFHRLYQFDEEGNVTDWTFEGAYRAPPYLMRYSVNQDSNTIGQEYYVCLECRQKNPDSYTPQQEAGNCEECGNRTYEAAAYMLNSPQGDPEQFFVDGEFAHDSEYRPTRLYGLSPIISLTEEVHTLQNMDEWHRMAYEKRRAPRGAIVIRGANSSSVRAYNKEQMNKLNSDPQHIPVFMDDSEDGSGSPMDWQPLLESPADMQNSEMREWFKDRISAKYGVTAVFQQGTADATGMSQSLEIVVANRSTQRLQGVFEDTFIPAFLGQIGANGWKKELRPPEEEDESAKAQLIGTRLQNARTANDIGFEIEWTRDDKLDIKPDTIEPPEEGEGGGLGDLFGPDPKAPSSTPGQGVTGVDMATDVEDTVVQAEPADGDADEDDYMHSHPSDNPTAEEDGVDPAGTTSTTGGRPKEPEEMGGKPDHPDHPTSEEPYRRSDGTVTTSTSGYSNASFSGKPGEVIDILRDIEDDDGKMKDEKLNLVEQHYKQCVNASKGSLPDFEQIEGSCRNRPDRDYRAFKRNQSGNWTRNFYADDFVKQVYHFVDGVLNEDE
jgi:hypothetical protein